MADILDVGFACTCHATPYARRMAGGTIYGDGGSHPRTRRTLMSAAIRDVKGRATDRKKTVQGPLIADELRLLDAYWRAANYLSIGQIHLYDNPLLKKPLSRDHIKPRLLGHWGTTPGLNFICVHLNRVITRYDLSMLYLTGPGHGGRVWSPTPTWREPTARSTPTSRRTRRE
jgi:xylulose-5-phosphate/fructose-6-phosphate phosphoketolase